jgi:CBS domain-containing protein
MNAAPTTIGSAETLADATTLMGERGLKRLPVVDKQGKLVGMLSRADILHSVAEVFPRDEHELAGSPATPKVAREVMRVDAPVVREDDRLPAVIDAICSTRLNRAIVVDGADRVVGVVSDAAVVKALGPAAKGIVASLMSKVGLGDAPDRPARDLMVTPACAVGPDATLAEVAKVMTEHRRKIVPVCDPAGRLLGIIDRADLLKATHAALADLSAPSDSDEED